MRPLGRRFRREPIREPRSGRSFRMEPRREPKIRSGSLGLTSLANFFQKKIEKKKLPANAWVKNISTKHRSAWLADAFKRSKAASFNIDVVRNVILPLAVNHPAKFAAGLGNGAMWFFLGLNTHAELFFNCLAEKKKLHEFVKRLYRKDHLAFCKPNSLAKGIAKSMEVFFNAMGEQGLNKFAYSLKKSQKTDGFLLGLKDSLGENHPLYLLAKKKLL